ncbi:MAG: ABC transporter permease [Mesorhizobium sp.]|nr:MAG: ABC transporter permease [Mesorhizobium sp.]
MTLHIDVPEETFGSILAKAFRNTAFVAGFVITVLILAMAVVSYGWTPYDVTRLVISDKMQAPSLAHWFGTDHFGRDLVDEALMRLNDLVFAFPALLSAIMITAIFGPGAVNAIIAIGIFNIPVFARVARAGALAIWPREFILAARAAGKSSTQISIEHVLPNIATLLLVQGTIQFALGILAEAGLSYLGLGAQPPMPSWGRMLFEAQTRMVVAPWMAIFPGMAIVITVLGLNLLGDGIADILDPKSRRQR